MASLHANGPYAEKLLCSNVLTADEYARPQIFRHPIYGFDEPIEWPPARWQEGRCQYCAHPFDRPGATPQSARVPVPPVPLPCMHDKQTQKWRVSGLFCSWNCAKAELLATQGFSVGSSSLLLEELAREVFGYTGEPIVPAPPKTQLSFFYPGADSLDIDTFRADSQQYFTTVMQPPLLSFPEVYERHSIAASIPTWSVKGIRASHLPTFEHSQTSGGRGAAEESLFCSFIQRQQDDDHKLPREDETPAEGTLLDWQDATTTAVACGSTDKL